MNDVTTKDSVTLMLITEKEKTNKRLYGVILASLVVNVIISLGFVWYLATSDVEVYNSGVISGNNHKIISDSKNSLSNTETINK